MTDLREKYAELMQTAVDGEASPEQLSELKEYLARHPEAQGEHAALAKLAGILNQVEAIETPSDLHANIMKSLPRGRSAANIGTWRNRWHLRFPLVQYGYAMAAGLVLGAVLTGVMFKSLSPEDKADVYGTIAPATQPMKVVGPNLSGTVELRRSGDSERAVFDLNSSQPVEIEVKLGGRRLGLAGFSQEPTAVSSFEAKEGIARFRSEGRQRSTLLLTGARPGNVGLNVAFYVEGKLVQEGRLGAAEDSQK